jgi:hypothetical protein
MQTFGSGVEWSGGVEPSNDRRAALAYFEPKPG